ncbi:hypothetical protein SERLA73DRAFT_128839 [Serpula lacrymans var. lacrymans S7.3]|uniref:Uncharacterized protein n=1 Tax=Serpula lacrymans var. lacrymans (strain S7.3) TaxID=936435 RepID=F8PHQ4_SERL3|nr:hypothetical protein SERLA73DRAFT_128839 [Serpula lacrymans var. lacrymans S7.3]
MPASSYPSSHAEAIKHSYKLLTEARRAKTNYSSQETRAKLIQSVGAQCNGRTPYEWQLDASLLCLCYFTKSVYLSSSRL